MVATLKSKKTPKKLVTAQIEEKLFKQVKKKAKDQGITLRQVIEYGMQLFLDSKGR